MFSVLSLFVSCVLGTLPEYYPPTLGVVQLGANLLNGTIPSGLVSLANLTQLNVGNNSLSGSLPSQLGNAKKLLALSLDSNFFTGTLNEVFNLNASSRFPILQMLSLSSNYFT